MQRGEDERARRLSCRVRSLSDPLPTPNEAHVRAAVERIVEAADPLRVVVFGSYARGEAVPGSDLDLLVVLPHVEHRREATVALRRALADLAVPKDVVVTSADEAHRRADSSWHVVGLALQQGRDVYVRGAP